MTTPTPKTYYNDFLDAGGFRKPDSRQPRFLDVYLSGPVGCGYIYTPSIYRDPRIGSGSGITFMISAATGIDITKTGNTGIMVAYKLVQNDGTQENTGTGLYDSPRKALTADNTTGITLGNGSAMALGVSFGSGVTVNTAYTFYIVNKTVGGNDGELIWRIQYITTSGVGSTGWHQYGVHQSDWPANISNTDGHSPELAFSYGAIYDGSGTTGYTGSIAGSVGTKSAIKLNEIKT